MSYAKDVKEEICKVNITDNSSLMACLEAMLRLSSEISIGSNGVTVSFITGNATVAKYFLELLKGYIKCEVSVVQKKVNKLNQQNNYLVNIETMSDLVIEEFGLLGESHNKDEIYASTDARRAYLRGAFLARGSVNDPNKSNYHLEMYTASEIEAIYIQKLMNSFSLNARIVKRRKDIVIYIKDINGIKDFLRLIGSSKLVFKLEEIQIQKSVSSNVQRVMNVEVANEQKSMNAALEQIRNIRYLEYNYPLEKLDPNLLLVMKVRKQNPESSLMELIDIIKERYDIVLTKSGLNHRFRKIKEIALEHAEAKKGAK